MRGTPTTVLACCLASAVVVALTGCGAAHVTAVPGGTAANGPRLVQAYGCGACHAIPGVRGADGEVGPSLAHFNDRRYIAGKLPNTAANLVRWIMAPQAVEPGTVMPDLGVGAPQARDLAAYLYRH
jgi:cytochrome c